MQIYPLPLFYYQSMGPSERLYIPPYSTFLTPHFVFFFVSTFSNCFADEFNISFSNSNVDQMAEALTAHSSNIEEWQMRED